MDILEIIKYAVLAVLVIVAFYILIRISASAVFRSYFEALKRSGHPPKKKE